MNTIYSLRKNGNKVRVIHYRNYLRKTDKEIFAFHRNEIDNRDNAFELLPHGGSIKIEVTTPTGDTGKGEAVCSTKDNFNRKVGNSIALGRALKKLDSFIV